MKILEVLSVAFALAVSYQLGQLYRRSDEINAQLEEQEELILNLRLKEMAQDNTLEQVVAVSNVHDQTLVKVLHHAQKHDEGHAKPTERMVA